MEFNDPKYIEVTLTKDEIDALNKAHNVIDHLLQYMENNNKTVYYYRDYDGSMSVDISEEGNKHDMQAALWILDQLTDLEGVE